MKSSRVPPDDNELPQHFFWLCSVWFLSSPLERKAVFSCPEKRVIHFLLKDEKFVFVLVSRAVKDLHWLAEATYTGEALDFALKNTIRLMRQENRVVLVLTDGRSDIIRDKVPLNVLCGNNVRVSPGLLWSHAHRVWSWHSKRFYWPAGGWSGSEGLLGPQAQPGAAGIRGV